MLAASLAGLGTGEFFGFHIKQIAILAPLFAPLGNFVGILNVSELTFDQGNKNTQSFGSNRHCPPVDGFLPKAS